MRGLCLDYGLRQLVRAPTRGKHLLDLCSLNIESASDEVVSKIAGNAIIMARPNLAIPLPNSMSPTVLSFQKADWYCRKKDPANQDWYFLDQYGPSGAAEELATRILDAAIKHIWQRRIRTKKRSHPWLTD